MRAAEATSKDVFVRLTNALVPDRDASGEERTLGEFASILSSMRRSSQHLSDVLSAEQQGAASEKARSARQSRSARAEDERSRSPERTNTDRPGRVDRLRDMVTEQEGKPAQPQAEPDSDTRERVDASAPNCGVEQENSRSELDGGHVSDLSALPVNQTGFAINQGQTGGQVSSASAPGSDASMVSGSPAALPGPDAAITNASVNAWVGAWGSNATGTAVRGGEGSANMQPTQSLQAISTAKAVNPNGTGGANAKGGSAGEFQNLLSELSRGNGLEQASAKSGLKAKPVNGGPEQPIDSRSVEALKELARIVRLQGGARQSSMTLMMSPPELGRLRIEMHMEADGLAVRFQTETQGGHEAVKGKLAELRSAIERQGIQLDRVDVEYFPANPPGSPGSEAPERQQHGEQWQAPDNYGQPPGDARQSRDEERPGGTESGGTDGDPAVNDWPGEQMTATEQQVERAVDLVA